MRKLLISILLASAAASPALAQDRGDHRDREDRAEHSQAREQRQEVREQRQQAREERSQAREQVRAERFGGGGFEARQQQSDRAAQFEMRQQQVQQQIQQQQRQQREARDFDRSRFQRGDRTPQQVTERQVTGQQDAGRTYRGYRGGFGDRQPQQVDEAQRSGSWSRDRGSWSRDRDGDFRQRSADQQHYRDRSRWASGGWNRDWRNDRRYDWRSYRDRHRSVFHIGIYYDPFGYSYRPFDIGYRLQPLYFGQRYWIDPMLYQLPYPPPGTQWVRYWNDAVLVDMYTGEVVDVIRNFFW